MKLLIDECIANSTRLVLESAGFEILKVEDVLESGVDDKVIFKYGADERIPIITHDRGFGVIYHFSEIQPTTIIIIPVLSPHPE